MNKLISSFSQTNLEVGIDEAGRGCLAGPVVAAAVILNPDKEINGLNDSKILSKDQRMVLSEEIKSKALFFAYGFIDNKRIDKVNILNASIEAMHQSIENLKIIPTHIIVDGNKFKPYQDIPYTTIVKGDSTFQSIAAASILAKTARDEFMCQINKDFPEYGWLQNKGYPTIQHKKNIEKFGLSPYHRFTFRHAITPRQLNLFD
ncbi:MAG: ribonuclease HII [Bacteroidetes bacterium]|nr:ribonuclease HII [Bacteroidota bacterium]